MFYLQTHPKTHMTAAKKTKNNYRLATESTKLQKTSNKNFEL